MRSPLSLQDGLARAGLQSRAFAPASFARRSGAGDVHPRPATRTRYVTQTQPRRPCGHPSSHGPPSAAATSSKEPTLESTPPQQHAQDLGTMVGLFWIQSTETYLGMSPVPPAPGVLLTSAGPQVLGPGPLQWSWTEVTDLRVSEAPVRSTAVRWAARVASVAAAALNAWIPASPAAPSRRREALLHSWLRDE